MQVIGVFIPNNTHRQITKKIRNDIVNMTQWKWKLMKFSFFCVVEKTFRKSVIMPYWEN